MNTFVLTINNALMLSEINNPKNKRNDIAKLYKSMIIWDEKYHTANWGDINRAIIKRWSRSGLEYIKRKAWRLVEEWEK